MTDLSDLYFMIGSSSATTGAFTPPTPTPSGCSIDLSIELSDIATSTWKPLDSPDYVSINNVLFTYFPLSKDFKVGLTSNNGFARSVPY